MLWVFYPGFFILGNISGKKKTYVCSDQHKNKIHIKFNVGEGLSDLFHLTPKRGSSVLKNFSLTVPLKGHPS